MREKIKLNHEAYSQPEADRAQGELLVTKPESQKDNIRHEHKDNLEAIISKIEKTAISGQDLSKYQKIPHKTEQSGPKYVSGELRDTALKRSLRNIQKSLNPYQKPFSRLIHNDAIEQISEAGAKTVARPEGLLFGGIAAFISSTVILIICRYYGYEYNYLIGLASFPAGYIFGILARLMYRRPLKK